MGRVVAAVAAGDSEVEVAAGIDLNLSSECAFPTYHDIAEFNGEFDVIVDFSAPSALDSLLKYGISKGKPVILCATGYNSEQLESIKKASEQIPVFKSSNMSLGINLLADLIRRACAVLGSDYDVEIVERHHRRKVDAPSGTALLLADAAADGLPYTPEYTYNREDRRKPRGSNEIGISAVRGGTIVGEHEVIFAGTDEVIELRHSAASNEVFAVGAIRAAKFIANVTEPGLYDMGDVLG